MTTPREITVRGCKSCPFYADGCFECYSECRLGPSVRTVQRGVPKGCPLRPDPERPGTGAVVVRLADSTEEQR
jgi:hypothetical protein